jgi:hypothetical protein
MALYAPPWCCPSPRQQFCTNALDPRSHPEIRADSILDCLKAEWNGRLDQAFASGGSHSSRRVHITDPWTKLWSVPNPWLGSTGAFWPDEFQREQAAMVIGMAKEAVHFWMGE